jgi:hypothetical protein
MAGDLQKDDVLHLEVDTKECELSPRDRELIDRDLKNLRGVVKYFPNADLYATIIFHPRSKTYHVKTSLLLPGKTLFTGDRDVEMRPAYNRCMRKLVQKVEAYKDELANVDRKEKFRKGTEQEVLPTQEPDPQVLQNAVENGDYGAFRMAGYVYEDPLRKRIGRWIQRYPEVERKLGDQFNLDDMVEEVFLNAFEHFDRRPDELRIGEWLENLIDPSVRVLLEHPDEEMENISFARSWWTEESGG